MKLFENKVGRPSNETLRKRKIFKISVTASVILLLSFGIFALFKFDVFNLKGASYGNVSITRTSVDPKQYNDGNRDWPLYVKRMEPYLVYVAEAASKYSVDPSLIMAIIMTESHAVPNLVSSAGCCGLMQVTPKYSQGHSCNQLKDPRTGILDGTKMMKDNLKRWPREQAICAYKQGSKPWTSCNYSRTVLKYEGIIKKLYTFKFSSGGNTQQNQTKQTITLSCPSSLKVNEMGKCTTNLSGVKISITKTNLASGYSTSFTTKSNDKVKNLKYTKAGTVTVTASKSGYTTVTKKVAIVANTQSAQKKSTNLSCTKSSYTLNESISCTAATGSLVEVIGLSPVSFKKSYNINSTGKVSFSVPKAGKYTIQATKSGYTTTKKTIEVASKKTLKAGDKVILKNVKFYGSSTTKTPATKTGKSGTYYVWNATVKNGRIRITTKSSYAGKTGKATAWVNVNELSY